MYGRALWKLITPAVRPEPVSLQRDTPTPKQQQQQRHVHDIPKKI